MDKLINRMSLYGARFQGPNSGFLLAGTWSVLLSGTRGSGSCLEDGGNDTGVFFPNSLPLISRFRHRSRGITCALKSTEVAHSQQASLRQDPVPLVLLAWVPLKPELILNPDDEAGALKFEPHAGRREFLLGGFWACEIRIRRFEEKGGDIVSLGTFPFSRPAVSFMKDSSEDLEISDFLFSGSKKERIRHIFRVPNT
ncbi:hypothetical protein F2Q68_00010254 [Brassica cretica]|uniref:Uncharacterized protein n=1 Tax=Brassica cretica TaxID=69181 RepID=A0A8S9KQT9_BRACR|nr:hypothetical protein F2Q68_00010254 [Brassica cretica]